MNEPNRVQASERVEALPRGPQALADDRALMTAEQLAGYLQAHINTIRTYVDEQIIPVAAWIGRHPRFHRSAVLEALSQRGPTHPNPKPIVTPQGTLERRGRLGKRPQGQPTP